MDVGIISTERIKPSSPTPSHLKTHRFCFLDQYFGHFFPYVVFYYPFNQDINLSNSSEIDDIVSERLKLLKQSLSETLTLYYPFAGKTKDKISVDCNDEGIYFVEARAKISLNEFLDQPNLSLIGKFVPLDGKEMSRRIEGQDVARIQVTTFACGGLAICNCIAHSFGDFTTLSLFLKSWTAVARKNIEEAISPDYNIASSLFPLKDEYPREATWEAQCTPFCKTGRFATGRFEFDAKAIANLKAKATSSRVQNPTRVEVLSAFLSKCVVATLKKYSGVHKPTLLTHGVNLRRKIKPSIADYSIGNILWRANVLCVEEEVELDVLVYQVSEAITKINADFVKSLQGDGEFRNFYKAIQDECEVLSGAAERIIFTSWCNFGFYDLDFGWGKPIWISPVTDAFWNFIVLVETRLGDGIDAWVSLPEEDMALLQLNQELLAFATLDPSPLETRLG